MRTAFIIPMLIIVSLFSCKKAIIQETEPRAQTKTASPSMNNKNSVKKYKPSDWTIKPFGYDFSVKNLNLMGFKTKGC